jgi:hypothetical protein
MKMKHGPLQTIPFRGMAGFIVMLIAMISFFTLTGCPKEADDGGSSGGGVSKPAALAPDATYDQAVAKLDEIIKYCEAHPGTVNNTMKTSAQNTKTSVTNLGSSGWSVGGAGMITAINSTISNLQ